jgi:metallo-beta-lactamase class B
MTAGPEIVRAAESEAQISAAVAAHRTAAERAAGTQWRTAQQFLCLGIGRTPPLNETPFEPQQLFDNLAISGDRSTAMYVLKTSVGVILIDSGYASNLESMLLPGLSKLHVDPADVKYIIVTHGHFDHFGGAPYFQQKYGTRVVASAADWDYVEHPPAQAQKLTVGAPRRDMVVGDDDLIRLGDTTIKSFLVPGHTPGALALIFPVKDGRQMRMAGLFGGLIIDDSLASTGQLQQYVSSLEHFADASRRNHVEVELENHIMFDDTFEKMQVVAAQKPGTPNPFVVGKRVTRVSCVSRASAHKLRWLVNRTEHSARPRFVSQL